MMSDITMKQYVMDVVKPFMEEELLQLKKRIKALEKAVNALEHEEIKEEDSLAAKAVKTASNNMKPKGKKKKKGAK